MCQSIYLLPLSWDHQFSFLCFHQFIILPEITFWYMTAMRLRETIHLMASGIFGLVTLTPSTFNPGAISENVRLHWKVLSSASDLHSNRAFETCQVSLKSRFQILVNLVKKLNVNFLEILVKRDQLNLLWIFNQLVRGMRILSWKYLEVVPRAELVELVVHLWLCTLIKTLWSFLVLCYSSTKTSTLTYLSRLPMNGELTFPISSIVKGGEKLSIRRAVVYLVKDERLVVLVSVVFDLRETLKVAKL